MPNWIYTCIIKVLDGRAKTLNDYKKHFEEGQMEINLCVRDSCVCGHIHIGKAKDMLSWAKGYLLVSNVFLFSSSFSSYVLRFRRSLCGLGTLPGVKCPSSCVKGLFACMCVCVRVSMSVCVGVGVSGGFSSSQCILWPHKVLLLAPFDIGRRSTVGWTRSWIPSPCQATRPAVIWIVHIHTLETSIPNTQFPPYPATFLQQTV